MLILRLLPAIKNKFYFQSDDQSASSRRLRLENERLQAEVTRLRNLLQQSGDIDTSEEADLEGNERMQALEHELRLAKEAVSGK